MPKLCVNDRKYCPGVRPSDASLSGLPPPRFRTRTIDEISMTCQTPNPSTVRLPESRRWIGFSIIFLAPLLAAFVPCFAMAAEYVEADVSTNLVPGPVLYSVLLPDGYRESEQPFPLLLDLHGGGGDRRYLGQMQSVYEQLWRTDQLPPLVVATPSVTPRGLYMDFRDGSQKWETFLLGEFLEHLRETYNVSQRREGTYITGISMGGMGALRMAFKHPNVFAGVAAMEPGIEPVLRWDELRPKHRFWRSDRLFEIVFGRPVDTAYWEANHPAAIVESDPQRLRDSGLAIYLECGDRDLFWLYEGTEFLHQVLWRNQIRHEYHLVYDADHVGISIRPRKIESLKFFARLIAPKEPDPRTARVRRLFQRAKDRLDEQGHLDPPDTEQQ